MAGPKDDLPPPRADEHTTAYLTAIHSEWRLMVRFLTTGRYVLGSRAGRERYAQIERICRQVFDHPAVQGAAGVVSAKIGNRRGGRSRNGEAP